MVSLLMLTKHWPPGGSNEDGVGHSLHRTVLKTEQLSSKRIGDGGRLKRILKAAVQLQETPLD